jgi:tetratricopeptide (TPR) repeat protein
MSTLFNGLLGFEIVLMCAGILLFIVAIWNLVRRIHKNASLRKADMFLFVLSLIFIGFPAYQKISFSKDGVELEKYTDSLLAHPTDTALQKQVTELVENLDTTRAAKDPEVLLKLSKANFAIGKKNEALKYYEKAHTLNPKVAPPRYLIQPHRPPPGR